MDVVRTRVLINHSATETMKGSSNNQPRPGMPSIQYIPSKSLKNDSGPFKLKDILENFGNVSVVPCHFRVVCLQHHPGRLVWHCPVQRHLSVAMLFATCFTRCLIT